MKLTKTLMAAVALVAFAAPMSASAQVVPGDVIGEAVSVSGDMVVLRNGNYLQLQNGSALLAQDVVFARSGSGTINLTGCNGKFDPCSQTLASGMKVDLSSGNPCDDLGNMMAIGSRDAVMSAGQRAVTSAGGSVGGATGGGIVGGASGLPLAAIGAIIAGGAAIAILTDDDDDDDDDASN